MKLFYTVLLLLLSMAAPAQQLLKFVRGAYYQQSNRIEMVWMATGNFRADSLVVFRADKTNGRFEKVPARLTYESKTDSIFYSITDSTVKKYMAYNYFLVTRNVVDKKPGATDTIFIAALDYLEMPMPENIMATPTTMGKGIQIKWQLKNAPLVKELTLYRSTNSVDGFQPIASLPLDRLEFTDNTAKPMTPYFYYFTITYKSQQLEKRGPSFAANFMDDTKPPVVNHFEADGTADGVRLSWKCNADYISGFWLYRGQGNQPLEPIATMIPAIDSIQEYYFTDTDSLLNGGKEYRYALQSYSTSHVYSDFSDTVFARPSKNIPVPKPPLNAFATVDVNDVFVSWEDVSAIDEWVYGYKLLRSRLIDTEKGIYGKADTVLTHLNFYVDSLIRPGESFRYNIISLSSLGVASPPSRDVFSSKEAIKPLAPGSLLATVDKQGVLLNWETADEESLLQYAIYRFESGQKPVKVATTKPGANTYIDKGADKGKNYYYYLKSMNDIGIESRKSNEARVVH